MKPQTTAEKMKSQRQAETLMRFAKIMGIVLEAENLNSSEIKVEHLNQTIDKNNNCESGGNPPIEEQVKEPELKTERRPRKLSPLWKISSAARCSTHAKLPKSPSNVYIPKGSVDPRIANKEELNQISKETLDRINRALGCSNSRTIYPKSIARKIILFVLWSSLFILIGITIATFL